jgi:queuine/archaeosine tRNA-ribosyltransferase
MEFYVSWTKSDPIYWKYDPECNILISPTGVPNNWNITSLNTKPCKFMIDSGAYYYIEKKEIFPSQKEVLKRQIEILEGCSTPVVICHLDYPISNKLSLREKNKRIDITISNAYEFQYLLKKISFKFPVELLATIQGYDVNSVKFCAKELKRIGYTYFGIGSLAGLFHPEEIIRRIRAVYEIVGENIHIFGISAVKIIKLLKRELPIKSFDSTRSIKAAIYSTVLYNEPEYGQYFIKGNRNKIPLTKFGTTRILKEPKECYCPICKKDETLIMKSGKKIYTNSRAIHNYFQLKEAFST